MFLLENENKISFRPSQEVSEASEVDFPFTRKLVGLVDEFSVGNKVEKV
jgi:hypothetical protein